ncbi:hypothetical protein F5Y16DRAFT_400845 [Xylariaceae sp. FL0255]|nr:hypothetical protein F5Y16DRAFT_400845 [Xylariaceae sp. FL0255]
MSHCLEAQRTTNLGSDSAEPTRDEIEKQPWKYVGYKRYAEFLASDDDLLIFRRFGTLNARIGLLLQDKITVLEQNLKHVDDACSDRNTEPINNGTFRDDVGKKKSLEIPEYEAKNVSYYSKTAMDAFASEIIVLIGAIILVLPLWILQALDETVTK